MSDIFFGKPVGHTRGNNVIFYDSAKREYGIEEEWTYLRDPTPEEMEEINSYSQQEKS